MASGSPNMRSFAKDRRSRTTSSPRHPARASWIRAPLPRPGSPSSSCLIAARRRRRRRHAPAVPDHRRRHRAGPHRGRVASPRSSRCSRSSTRGLPSPTAGSSAGRRRLIYDLRTAVFDHVQRMPLAFFSRAQTGALVQRLNGDVLGAQQAFTSTLQNVVSNPLTVVLVLAAMFVMSWQITLLRLVLLPLFVFPARWSGEVRRDHARELRAERDDAQMMTERFNVAGAHLVKVFGDPSASPADYAGQVGRVRDIGVTRALYSTVVPRRPDHLASRRRRPRLRRRRRHGDPRQLTVGVVVALTAYLSRLYGPLTAMSNVQVDVMTALVSFERVLEVLDLEPTVAEKPDAKDLRLRRRDARRDGRARRGRFRYPGADEVSLASLESVATLRPRSTEDTLDDVSFTVARGPHGRARRPLGRRQDDALAAGHPDVRPDRRRRPRSAAPTCATSRRPRCARRSAWSPRRPTCSTTRSRRTCATPARRPPTPTSSARCEQAQIADLVAHACPTASTPSSATAATGCPAASGSASRSPGMLLKAPDVVILDEATAHLDSGSEAAVQAALDEALAGRTSHRHRPPPVDGPARRLDRRPGPRPRRRPRHARRAARPRRRVRRALPHAVRRARAYRRRMIGRIDEVVFDCADPPVLGAFLGRRARRHPAGRDDGWHYVDPPGWTRVAFQRVPEGKVGEEPRAPRRRGRRHPGGDRSGGGARRDEGRRDPRRHRRLVPGAARPRGQRVVRGEARDLQPRLA